MDVGDLAPDFELAADDGRTVRLSEELKKGRVVLFFYPKAMTPGCTAESCTFRDRGKEFEELGAQRLGISLDSVNKQHQFSTKHNFDFTLLSDKGGQVAKEFGLNRPLPIRYGLMMYHLFIKQDLTSYVNIGDRIIPQITAAAPITLSLIAGAIVIWLLVGTSAGVIAEPSDHFTPVRIAKVIDLPALPHL